jgi:hypothetical protein
MTENILNVLADLQLINDNDEAFASIGLNTNFTWAKIRVCDAFANANKQRIPKEEFDNLVKTGLYAPIKIAPGSIKDGHLRFIPGYLLRALNVALSEYSFTKIFLSSSCFKHHPSGFGIIGVILKSLHIIWIFIFYTVIIP